MKSLLAALLVLLSTSMASRASELSLKPALLPDDGYSETFSVSAALPDGWVQIQIVVTNMGPGSGRAVCRVMLSLPGLQWTEQEMISPGDWTYHAPELTVGSCRASPTHVVMTTKQGGKVEMVLESAQIPLRVPTLGADGTTAGLEIALADHPIPASLTVTPKGEQARVYRSAAWLSHDLAHRSLNHFGTRWFRFRSIDAQAPIFGIVLAEKGKNVGRGWIAGQGLAPTKITASGLSENAATGKKSFGLQLTDTELRLHPTESVLAFEPLHEMGIIGRMMGAIVGDPILSVFRIEWDSPKGMRKGVLETMVFR